MVSNLGRGGRIVIVDDHPATCMILRRIFESDFEVLIVHSGEQCLELVTKLDGETLDVILMDIVMPGGMDGFETCRRLRELTDAPVIFVSGRNEPEVWLEALDAGGQDFVLKPPDVRALLRKAKLLVQMHRERRQLQCDNQQVLEVAHTALSCVSESGILLSFMRRALAQKDLYALADEMIAACAEYGLYSHVQILEGGMAVTKTGVGNDASPLEVAVFEQSRTLGRQFSFGRRFIVNYDHLSILVLNMPPLEDPVAGRIRDNITILAEIAQGVAEVIARNLAAAYKTEDIQVESQRAHIAVSQLLLSYQEHQAETRVQLALLVDGFRSATERLDLTDEQTSVLTQVVSGFEANFLQLFDDGVEDARTRVAGILNTLIPKRSDDFQWL